VNFRLFCPPSEMGIGVFTAHPILIHSLTYALVSGKIGRQRASSSVSI